MSCRVFCFFAKFSHEKIHCCLFTISGIFSTADGGAQPIPSDETKNNSGQRFPKLPELDLISELPDIQGE